MHQVKGGLSAGSFGRGGPTRPGAPGPAPYTYGPYNAATQVNGVNEANKVASRPADSVGISAWGLITLIMLVIGIGMGIYYGVICYPLICKEERNYDIMDAASTTASANTPTRSSDFEKSGNYSSRSTTPSVIISS